MRRTLCTALLIAVAAGIPAAAGGDPKEIKAVARRVFEEIFNKGRYEVADEIYARDFVNHGVGREIGLKEDQDAARGWRAAFPDIRMTVETMIVEGDLVAVLWSVEGTNTGEGNGLPATGKRMEGRGITIWRIVDGKIREEWTEFDMLPLLKQLGLLPPQRK